VAVDILIGGGYAVEQKHPPHGHGQSFGGYFISAKLAGAANFDLANGNFFARQIIGGGVQASGIDALGVNRL
jgi:hypothetical protein